MSELEIEIDKRLFSPRQGGRGAFYNFVASAWPYISGDPNSTRFTACRYMEVLCSDVYQPFWQQRLSCPAYDPEREEWARWTLLNIPPSHSKSILANVLLPAWVWGPAGDPTHAFGHLSYDLAGVSRDARKCRSLIQSDWYSARWPDAAIADGDNQVHYYSNRSGGYRYCNTIRGGITGKHFNSILLDDPQNPSKLKLSETTESAAEAEKAREVIDDVLPSRILGEDARYMIIMQRLSQQDASAHLLEKYT